jgi:hypothetical protein
LRSTYHAECADELFGWLGAHDIDHLHEVAADADDDDHAEGLEDADKEEHLAQRHGTVAGDRHVGGWWWSKRALKESRSLEVEFGMRSTLFVTIEDRREGDLTKETRKSQGKEERN